MSIEYSLRNIIEDGDSGFPVKDFTGRYVSISPENLVRLTKKYSMMIHDIFNGSCVSLPNPAGINDGFGLWTGLILFYSPFKIDYAMTTFEIAHLELQLGIFSENSYIELIGRSLTGKLDIIIYKCLHMGTRWEFISKIFDIESPDEKIQNSIELLRSLYEP